MKCIKCKEEIYPEYAHTHICKQFNNETGDSGRIALVYSDVELTNIALRDNKPEIVRWLATVCQKQLQIEKLEAELTKIRQERSPKLIIANGRGSSRIEDHKTVSYETFYVCAKSISDMVRLMQEYGFYTSRNEINKYWSKGCWGKAMDKIIPERGIWATKRIPYSETKPEKLSK